jgi:hypothetical protein
MPRQRLAFRIGAVVIPLKRMRSQFCLAELQQPKWSAFASCQRFPAEHLAEELRELRMSAADLARKIGVPTNRITSILHGQRAITGGALLWDEPRVLAEPIEPLRTARWPEEIRKSY